jgi:phage tail protein X
MAIETLVVTHELTPLDLLLWRRFKAVPEGMVERTLDINPGLAARGAILPVGTRVEVELPDPSAPRRAPLVTLWD